MNNKISVSIVIVNFNGGNLITSCIKSIIIETKLEHYEIIVVDNNSTDDSIEKIKEYFPTVILIENNDNVGFAKANNIGFKIAKGNYILVLNPDTLILRNAIDQSIAYIKNHPEIGILGCKVLSSDGVRQASLMKYPTLKSILVNIFIPYEKISNNIWLGKRFYEDLNYNIPHDVDVVVGCYMLLPHSILDDIGGFDEDFFMYVEEVEWCWRISQAGKKVRYYPESSIIHHGGGCSSSLSYRKTLLMAKGSLMFFEKTRGKFIAIIVNLLMIIRDLPRVLLWIGVYLINPKKSLTLKKFYFRFIYLFKYLVGIKKI